MNPGYKDACLRFYRIPSSYLTAALHSIKQMPPTTEIMEYGVDNMARPGFWGHFAFRPSLLLWAYKLAVMAVP